MNEIQESLRKFITKFCNGNTDKMTSDVNQVREVSIYIMNFCDKLIPSTGHFSPSSIDPIVLPNDTAAKNRLRSDVMIACKTITTNKYWSEWELREGDGEHQLAVEMKNRVIQLCKDSNDETVKQEIMYTDLNFDEDNLTPSDKIERRMHEYCPLNGYFGPQSKDNENKISQIRTMNCFNKNVKKNSRTAVLVVMHHLLYDYCVERYAFRKNLSTKKNIPAKIDEDIGMYDTLSKLMIINEMMIRIKMSIFLRIFEGVCCNFQEVDGSHWDRIIKMTRLMDGLFKARIKEEVNRSNEEENRMENEAEAIEDEDS